MSFKRNVQRDKKVEFTHQEVHKTEYQSNFNFSWIPHTTISIIILAVIFLFSQFICVPMISHYIGIKPSLVLTHGLISSLLVVLAFQLLNKEKWNLYYLFLRFCFCLMIFGGFAFAITLFM